MDEIGSKLTAHGPLQVELSCSYPISLSRLGRYRLEVYLYSPAQLGVDEDSYGVESFFADLKTYTRFGIVGIPLARLSDPDCSISPLTRIREVLKKAALPGDVDEPRLLYELRSLVNLYTTTLKENLLILRNAVTEAVQPATLEKVRDLLKDMNGFLKVFRSLNKLFLEPPVGELPRSALKWADESICLNTEKMLVQLHLLFDGLPKTKKIFEAIRELLRSETTHRRNMDYDVTAETEKSLDIERILYRESVLKKWAHTVLYISTEESGRRRQMAHVLAGISAALAMSFAVAAAILADKYFKDNSLIWVLVIVISYIFKDRIKEILRGLLVRLVPGLVNDRQTRLVDQATGKRVGRTRSLLCFPRPTELPAALRRLRDTGVNPFRSILPTENVHFLRRDILIQNEKLRKEHTRLESVADILRFKLDRFTVEMDNPKKALRTVAGEGIRVVRGRRVYHINMIVGLTAGEEPRYVRYRLVMTRQGLERIETVEGPGS